MKKFRATYKGYVFATVELDAEDMEEAEEKFQEVEFHLSDVTGNGVTSSQGSICAGDMDFDEGADIQEC